MVAEAVKTALAATVERKALAWATDIAADAGAKAKALEILKMIRLEVKDNELIVEGTDLSAWSVRLTIPAPMGLDGAILVNGALMSGAAKTFGGDSLAFDLRDSTLQLKGAGRLAKLATRDPDDFPPFHFEDPEPIGVVDGATFKAALRRVAWAAATDQSRAVLTGVNFHIEGERLEFAAADGFCLAVDSMPISDAPEGGWSGIVDGVAIRAFLAHDFPEGAYTITRSGNRIRLETPGVQVTAMLIPGAFPNYRQLIPTQQADGVTIKTADALELLTRAKLFTRDGGAPASAALRTDGKLLHAVGNIRLRTVSGGIESLAMSEINRMEDRVDGETGGITGPWRTAVDLGRLESALKGAGTESVTLQPGGDPPETGAPIKLWTEDGWIGLVMPMFMADPAGWAEGQSK